MDPSENSDSSAVVAPAKSPQLTVLDGQCVTVNRVVAFKEEAGERKAPSIDTTSTVVPGGDPSPANTVRLGRRGSTEAEHLPPITADHDDADSTKEDQEDAGDLSMAHHRRNSSLALPRHVAIAVNEASTSSSPGPNQFPPGARRDTEDESIAPSAATISPVDENLLVDDYGFVYKKGLEADKMASKDRFHAISSLPAYRRLENRWVEIISNWDQAKHITIKELSRQGIPDSVRGRVWQLLAGSIAATKPGEFDKLRQKEAIPIYDVIERDINRCYPDHSFFRAENSQGQRDLFDILKAYAHYNPEIGYCQGMGRLVGMMLMQIPAEDSFWLLVATIDKYVSGYYSPGLDRLRMHAMVFEKLLYKHIPKLAKHLADNDVTPLIYMTNWFLTLFTMTLPWPTVLRVWDMFYCDGVKVLFRVGLAILLRTKNHILRKCPTSTEILEFLLHIPYDYLEAEKLLKVALNITISRKEVELLEAEAAQVWKQTGAPERGTLTLNRRRKDPK